MLQLWVTHVGTCATHLEALRDPSCEFARVMLRLSTTSIVSYSTRVSGLSV